MKNTQKELKKENLKPYSAPQMKNLSVAKTKGGSNSGSKENPHFHS